jgi:hypothetical protein
MTIELWSNTQLLDAIDSLLARAERDESLRAGLAAQLTNIYFGRACAQQRAGRIALSSAKWMKH